MKFNFAVILVMIVFALTGCGTKKPLNELRTSKEGLQSTRVVNVSMEDVKKRIRNDAYNNSSLFKIFESADGAKVSMIRQLDYGGEILCFIDFEKEDNNVRVSVYNYVCSQNFIDGTLKMALP